MWRQPFLGPGYVFHRQRHVVTPTDLDEELGERRVRMKDSLAGIQEDDVDVAVRWLGRHAPARALSSCQTRSASRDSASSEPSLRTTRSALSIRSSSVSWA